VNAGGRLGAYGVALVAVLGGGAAVGAAAGPIDVGGSEHVAADEPVPALPAGGLLVSQGGYSFVPEDRQLGGPFRFAITGPDGDPVTEYDDLHDRELHLIVASRDLQQYAHVHPVRDDGGTWSVDLPTLPAGAYRAFADFRPAGGEQITLGVDVAVAGAAAPAATLRPSSVDEVAGFEVTLEADPAVGAATVTVRRGGEVVTTEPYLGAAGHLVALRDGDLAYLHVHPLDDAPAGPVAFAVEYPSAGTYALFFDFQVDGEVRTARFVVEAGAVDGGDVGGHGEGGH
jgi:hypothetical protein